MEQNVPIKSRNSMPAVGPLQATTSTSFTQLEENINKWSQELEKQEQIFNDQVMQLNSRDRILFANRERIDELNNVIKAAEDEQQTLEYELSFMHAEQKELEKLLAPMEKLIEHPAVTLWDSERHNMYYEAENLEMQIRQMSEDLKDVIVYFNEKIRSQDTNDPIVQIGRILDAHMSSMQWIDNTITQISIKLDQLSANQNHFRTDNERSYP